MSNAKNMDANQYAGNSVEPAISGPGDSSCPLNFRELCQRIREDWSCNGRDWTRPGFRAIAICRFGQWRMRVRYKLLRYFLGVLYRILYRRARNVYGIELPYTVSLGRRVIIEHQGSIVVHGNVSIGDDCILRQNVTIGNRYIEKPFEAPQLGNRINVGAGAVLIGNIRIGDGASIGANTVVLRDVSPGQTVVGRN